MADARIDAARRPRADERLRIAARFGGGRGGMRGMETLIRRVLCRGQVNRGWPPWSAQTLTPTMGEPRTGDRSSHPAHDPPERRRSCDQVPLGHRPWTPMRRRKPTGPRQTPAQCAKQSCARQIRNPPTAQPPPAQFDCAGSSTGCATPVWGRAVGCATPVDGAQPGCATAERPGWRCVVGPTMSPTTAARRLCCRIVTDGRGSWPSAWSGSAGELTTWNTRTPAHPGPWPTGPPRRARCAALATGRGPLRGHGGEPLRGRRPPRRDGGRSVHPDRQRAVP
jgi:hypothetical protein